MSLEAEGRRGEIAQECRRTVETGYTLESEVQRFGSLYGEIIHEDQNAEGGDAKK